MTSRTLTCPYCGWTGRTLGAHAAGFRYLEEVTSIRSVEGFGASGVLRVDARERIGIEDPGRRPRLLCGDCLAEFPLPRGTVLDFVS